MGRSALEQDARGSRPARSRCSPVRPEPAPCLGAGRTAHAAAERFHTGQQLTDAEGLGHSVVGTDGQAADLILPCPLGTWCMMMPIFWSVRRMNFGQSEKPFMPGSIMSRMARHSPAAAPEEAGPLALSASTALHPGQTQVQRYHLANATHLPLPEPDHLSFLRFYPVCLMRKARYVTKNHFIQSASDSPCLPMASPGAIRTDCRQWRKQEEPVGASGQQMRAESEADAGSRNLTLAPAP